MSLATRTGGIALWLLWLAGAGRPDASPGRAPASLTFFETGKRGKGAT